MGDLDNNVNRYLDEVGVHSDEHRKYLEKLKKVLSDMKNSSVSAERKHYFSFNETVEAFDRYLTEKKIKLTSGEKDRFGVIAASGLNNLAKKRMAEDLIHQVKDRVSSEIELKAEEGKRREDIARLKKSGFWLKDWYRLTKFALEFGTITLFSHQYRSNSFDVIRSQAASAHREIIRDLRKILDSFYFYLSVLEYNSLVRLVKMGEALERLESVRRIPSYHPMELFEAMNDFAGIYISVVRNVGSVDRGLKKVLKEFQPAHGFMGFIGFLTDRQVENSRSVRHNISDRIRKTIAGSLYSYYTAYTGVRVSTFNQLMYIVSEEGMLNGSTKEYTSAAIHAIESESHENTTEKTKVSTRLSELKNITTRYIDAGNTLSKRLFELEARSGLTAWNRDSKIKPFFRTMKVFDAYLKYVLEIILARENLDLEYDGRIVSDYFDRFPDLLKAVEDCRTFSMELQGARGKDLQNFKHPQEISREEYIETLMTHDNVLALPGETRLMRETLNLISSKCYNICMRFNDVVNRFSKSGRVESTDFTENYNFLLNARLVHPKVRGLETLLNRKEIFLIDYLEAGCSVAGHLAESLKNSGIKAVNDEVVKLMKEMEKYGPETGPEDITAIEADDENQNRDMDFDINKIYSDALTGLKRWEYYEDFIVPEYYDEKGNFSGDRPRHIFCAELANLVDINRACGNDAGDTVYRKLGEFIMENVVSAGEGNVAVRTGMGVIIGYFNDISAYESVDILFRVLHLMKEFSLSSEIESLPELVFRAGLYTERKGTNGLKNIEVARSLMIQAEEGAGGHVAFLRNQDRILGDNDFDRRGRIREDLVSVLK